MKRFHYESKVAKLLLGFSGCHTITIGPLVFSKRPESKVSQRLRNHEACHADQWCEVTGATLLILLACHMAFGIPVWWLWTAALEYYIWYGLEYLVKLAVYRDAGKAYKAVCFEREAYSNELDDNYTENRRLFSGWLERIWR